MTTKNIKLANSAPYNRDVLDAGDLKELAKLVPAEKSLVARLPIVNDPGFHLIGIGDGIDMNEPLEVSGTKASSVTRIL